MKNFRNHRMNESSEMKTVIIDDADFEEDVNEIEGSASHSGYGRVNKELEEDWKAAKSFQFPVELKVPVDASPRRICDDFNYKFFRFSSVKASEVFLADEDDDVEYEVEESCDKPVKEADEHVDQHYFNDKDEIVFKVIDASFVENIDAITKYQEEHGEEDIDELMDKAYEYSYKFDEKFPVEVEVPVSVKSEEEVCDAFNEKYFKDAFVHADHIYFDDDEDFFSYSLDEIKEVEQKVKDLQGLVFLETEDGELYLCTELDEKARKLTLGCGYAMGNAGTVKPEFQIQYNLATSLDDNLADLADVVRESGVKILGEGDVEESCKKDSKKVVKESDDEGWNRPAECCAWCTAFKDGLCRQFNKKTLPTYVCDDFDEKMDIQPWDKDWSVDFPERYEEYIQLDPDDDFETWMRKNHLQELRDFGAQEGYDEYGRVIRK